MSSDANFCIDLEKRIDSDNRVYYIAKLRAPITIRCDEGICFLIFTSEEGGEEMQIAPMTKKHKEQRGNFNE